MNHLMNKRHFLHAALALATASLALQAPAQDFPPKKTVTMVVGFAAGGAADTGARTATERSSCSTMSEVSMPSAENTPESEGT